MLKMRRRHAPPAAVKRSADKHIVCSKTLTAKAGEEEKVNELCAALVAAAGPASAPGVVEFSFGRDAYDPQTFHFWERYDSNVSLGRHNTRADVTAFMEEVRRESVAAVPSPGWPPPPAPTPRPPSAPQVITHLEGPVGMVLYEWRDGQLSSACAQGGPKGEGGLDDATGGSGMAGGASLKQSSATLDMGNITRGDEGDAWGMKAMPWMKKILGGGEKEE